MPAAGAHRTPTYKTGVQRIYSDLAKLGIWDHISRGGHGDPTVSHAAPSGASASFLPQHRQHRQIHSPLCGDPEASLPGQGADQPERGRRPALLPGAKATGGPRQTALTMLTVIIVPRSRGTRLSAPPRNPSRGPWGGCVLKCSF
jgi:hypothetical protein